MATSVEPELCSAARTNDLATIERLLASGNADLAALGPNGFNPTHAAAHAGADAVLGALLAAGADASILSGRGDSALHLAAHGGHEGAVALLLNIGGDTTATTVDQPNASGWTPLALCVISAASAAARLRCARLLLARGADPGRAAQGGWSAALLAAQRGDAALLGALLGVGGDGDGGATAQRLLAATTPEGDTPLLLAAHAGSPDALRLLLAAGTPETARARNRRGLGAIDLAVCGACAAPAAAEPPPPASDDAAAATDAQTARFDEAVRVLAAELTDGSGRLPPGAAETPSPLHVVACAPPQVGARRLAALAATLRRVGLDGGDDATADAAAAADGAPPPASAAAAAERRGRAELAALLRAPTPPRGPLVALRVPYEGGAPSTLTVVEGAIAVPPLDAEAPELKHALASRSRAALGRQGVQGGGGAAADGDADGGLAAEALATATEEAVARAGGVARRERRFALLAEVSPDAKGALKPAAVDAAIRRAAKRAGKRPPPPSAAALARAAQEAVDGAAAAAAGAASETPPVRYRQSRRWSSATVEVVELTAAKGAPVVRPQHLAMLREAFGGTLPDDLLEADEARGWALYEEEVNGAAAGAAAGSADGGVGGGAPAVAEVFSLDAPLLLAFLSTPAGGDEEMEAGGGGGADAGEEGEGEGEDGADGDADALAESRMDVGS